MDNQSSINTNYSKIQHIHIEVKVTKKQDSLNELKDVSTNEIMSSFENF